MYISKVVICTLLMLNVLALSSLTDRCSPEYCNFAGECKIVKGKPTCSCYEEAFLGKYCEQVRNLCETEKNNCTAKQICVPYVGHTICDCPPKGGGYDSCERLAPTKLMCSYNVRAVYGIVELIILSFEQLGTEPLRITISTPTYLITDVPRLRTVSSQYTNNLTAILQGLGIRRHINLPYNSGHYYVFHAKHFTLGPNQLSVTVDSFGKGNRSQTLSLIVHVVQPRHCFCFPRIVFQHGMDPKKPRQLDIERFNNIQAIVEKRCSPSDLRMRVKWTIYNENESLILFSTEVMEHLLLKIPRHTLWHVNVLSLYPNILLTVQVALQESDSPWVYERCFINLTARNVVANIAGAHYKEVSENSKWLILDGSKSREPAINLREPQQLTYTWVLSSEDGSNKQYLSLESSNSKLNISTTILKRGEKNVITLTVANKIVNARNNTISQVIVLTSNKNQLSVDIDCIRNCNGNLYAVDRVLHLRAVCHTCNMPVSYTWTVNEANVQQNKQRLVIKLATDLIGEIVVKLYIRNQFGKGYTELRLRESKPPAGGNCEIEPTNGLECVTKFKIRCQNFSSLLQEPLWYTFKTGAIYEDSTKSGETFLYLHGNTPLTVHICNSHFQCTFVNIPFTVVPMSLNSSKTVQKHNLASMLIAGQRQQAFCLLQTVSSIPENIDAVLKYFQSIKFDGTLTLLEMVNTLQIAYITISYVGSLESNEARAISYILERVIVSFDFVRKDTEILDMSEEICLDLGKVITNIVTYCMEANTKLLKQSLILWESDNPFSENYVDWLSFDSKIALRISRYSEIVNLIFQIWWRIGEESTRYIQPEEPFEYISKNVSYRLEMHDSHDPIEYSSSCESCHLIVPLPEVVALRKMLGTKYLLIYAWCFQTNIFWWVPEDIPPRTALLAVNILGRNAPYKLETKSNQKYSLNLRRVEDTTDFVYNQTDVIFQNMIIYKLKLQGQVSLIVKFISSTGALRVLITMHVEPTLENLHDRSCFVPRDCSNSTIVLKNRCTEEGMAYIAVYKANSNDTAPVRYTFRLRAQEFNVWGVRNNYPNWVKQGCYSQNLLRGPAVAQCQVNPMSVFSAKEYEIQPLRIKEIRNYDFIPSLNIGYVIFNCLLFLGGLSLLLMGALRLRHTNANLIRVVGWEKVDPQTENVIVQLRTGGNFLGSTTANIKLVFISELGRYKVVIYQNPMNPILDLNTSCVLRLSDRKVQLPCRLTISHDFSGRYPTWNCRSVQVDDLRRNLSYTFHIHSWIRRAEKIIVSCLPTEKQSIKNRLHQVREEQGCWRRLIQRFRYYSKYYYTSWFMLQPILGPWRYSDESFNIYERTCIWICKTVLTVTIVFCYYRYSSTQHFFEFKERLTLTNTSEFLAIAIGSYIAATICDLCLIHLILTLSNM